MSALHDILDKSGFSAVTRSTYSNIIDRWIAFAGEDPGNWTRIKAQEFYDWLLDNGVKVKTANHYIASLRYVSKWYSTKIGRPETDFAIVQTRADERAKEKARRALIPEEIERLLVQCTAKQATPVDHRDFVLFVIGFETGMRRKSLVGMQLDKIGVHPQHNYPLVKVPIKGPGGIIEFDVPLSDLCMATLGPWVAWLTKHKHTQGPVFTQLPRSMDKRGQISWAPTDSSISMQMINKIVKQRSEAAGLGHMHPHLLRHTFISSREAANVPQSQIAAVTGHSLGSRVSEDGFKWGQMAGYIDLAALGATARNTTPPWFATLVANLNQVFTKNV